MERRSVFQPNTEDRNTHRFDSATKLECSDGTTRQQWCEIEGIGGGEDRDVFSGPDVSSDMGRVM
jgi:hypothetical protein